MPVPLYDIVNGGADIHFCENNGIEIISLIFQWFKNVSRETSIKSIQNKMNPTKTLPNVFRRDVQKFRKLVQNAGIVVSNETMLLLIEYISLVLNWNDKFNLVSSDDEPRIFTRHIFESLLLTKTADFNGTKKMLDIGSGAGFPAIPLKLWNPNLQITMIESRRKKVIFLNNIIEQLGLDGTAACWMRAEDSNTDESLQNAFDIVTARAVTALPRLLQLAKPYLSINKSQKGICVFPKGSAAFQEAGRINRRIWNVSIQDVTSFLLDKIPPLYVVIAYKIDT
jgi:16S rRNA (guanine527-N7)-methyltransferase